jgi:signal transduction histidine kinase
MLPTRGSLVIIYWLAAAEPTPTPTPQYCKQTLTISDTGRGFDPATTGTGLTNMTDRLSAIDGYLDFDTAPGGGTRITAVIATPLQPASAVP